MLCGYHLALVRPSQTYRWKVSIWAFIEGINDQFQVNATGITRFGLSKYWLDNGLLPCHQSMSKTELVGLSFKSVTDRERNQQKQHLIELLQEKRQALISQAVTRDLIPSPYEGFGI